MLSTRGSLVNLDEALKRCQNPRLMHMTVHSNYLTLTAAQSNSIRVLKGALRNRFAHYQPGLWSIDLQGMPWITLDVLDVVKFLALETGNYVNLTGTQQRAVRSLVYQSKNFILRHYQ